jgi:thiol:disulfide interchange protein
MSGVTALVIPSHMFLLAVLVVSTLTQRPSDVVHWTAVGPAARVNAGETATIKVTAEIEPGWHLYALTQPEGGPRRLEIKTAKSSAFPVVADGVSGPLPKVEHDPNFNVEAHYYEEKTTIDVPVAVTAAAQAGKRIVPLEITYQVCSGQLCLRPTTDTIQADVIVGAKDRR